MKKSVYKSYDELPLFLNAELVGEVLGASSTTAYELFHQMLCEDRKAYQCHLNFRTTGRSVGFSRNTVKKYVTGVGPLNLKRKHPAGKSKSASQKVHQVSAQCR